MEIGERLLAISKFVKNCSKIADIGTDHAKLPVYLIKQGKIDFAIASDKNEGPLMFARETIRRAGLSGKIDVRLGDGLKSLKPGEVDTVIIAGMGGNLIAKILEDSKEVLETVDNLILQPMNDGKTLRLWLGKNHWRIENEILTQEMLNKKDKKIYEIFSAVQEKSEKILKYDSDVELLLGPIILQNKNELLKERIMEFIDKEKRKIFGMEKSEDAKKSQEYIVAKERLQALEALLW